MPKATLNTSTPTATAVTVRVVGTHKIFLGGKIRNPGDTFTATPQTIAKLRDRTAIETVVPPSYAPVQSTSQSV